MAGIYGIWERGYTDPAQITDDMLRERIAQTVAWCDALTVLPSFRGPGIAPRLLHDGLDDLVCELGGNRQDALRSEPREAKLPLRVSAAGRFMLHLPDQNLCDGYSQQISDGFFDGDNVPPWDTWVSFHVEQVAWLPYPCRYILCYVPMSVVKLAQAGIDGNAEGCIEWLDKLDVQIGRRVARLVR